MISNTSRRRFVDLSSKFSDRLLRSPGLLGHINSALDATGRWHERECILTAPVVVAAVLLLALERALSIARVVNRAVLLFRSGEGDLPLRSVTPEALCHARARLGLEPMRALFEAYASSIRPRATFHSLRVWAIDAVDNRVPDTPSNVDAFGLPGSTKARAAFPQVGATVLLDVANRRVRGVVLGEPTESERDGAIALAQHLGPQDLVIMDRGLAAAWMFDHLGKRQIDWLVRIPDNWEPEKIRELGRGDYLVRLTGVRPLWLRGTADATEDARTITMDMRMIVSKVPGHPPVRLLTSLTDHKKYRARELAFHYHARWDIEMAFDELKTHFATVPHGTMRTTFRSKTPEGVLQEAYGLFAAYNFVRDLMKQAAERYGMSPLRISFVEALDLIRWAVPNFTRDWNGFPAIYSQLLCDVAACKIARPRRRRICPRVIKTKTSRYRTKRPFHVETDNLILSDLTLVRARFRSRCAA